MKIPYGGASGSLIVMALALQGGVLTAGEKEVEYGKYLVAEVAQCQRCHTPKLESGELDKSKWMKGATLDIQPVDTIKGWHKTSPDLTPSGRLWQRWTEAGLLKFMVTGLGPKGNAADPPMPPYRLTQKAAEAV